MRLGGVEVHGVPGDEVLLVAVVDEPEAAGDDVIELLALMGLRTDLALLLLLDVRGPDQERVGGLVGEVRGEMAVIVPAPSLDRQAHAVMGDDVALEAGVLAGDELDRVDAEAVGAFGYEREGEVDGLLLTSDVLVLGEAGGLRHLGGGDAAELAHGPDALGDLVNSVHDRSLLMFPWPPQIIMPSLPTESMTSPSLERVSLRAARSFSGSLGTNGAMLLNSALSGMTSLVLQ